MATQQIINAQKLLEETRKRCGVDARLSTSLVNSDRDLQQDLAQSASTPVDDARPLMVRGAAQTTHPAPTVPQTPRMPQGERIQPEVCKVDPTVANAYYGRDPRDKSRTLARVGAVYFQCQAHDLQGAGRIAKSDAIDIMVNDVGMTDRHARGIIKQGRDIAWRVTDDYLYLQSPAAVAIALNAGPLRGRRVNVPYVDFCGGTQQVKATLYATYHGGCRASMPKTRRAIRELTGVPERTQAIYDKVAGVKVSYNIGTENEEPTRENYQRRAWEHGRAAFKLFDLKKRKTVIAWRLPNSYDADYPQAPRGRQRKHNRRINLVIKRQQDHDADIVQMYFPTAKLAERQATRNPEHDRYYPNGRTLTFAASKPAKLKGVNVWEQVSA